MNFVAYHDRTSADHQAHFDDLFPRGFRMISLSVYGNRGDERYAAIWVERPGPDWSAVHGVNGAGYQAAFNSAAAAGFLLEHLVSERNLARNTQRSYRDTFCLLIPFAAEQLAKGR